MGRRTMKRARRRRMPDVTCDCVDIVQSMELNAMPYVRHQEYYVKIVRFDMRNGNGHLMIPETGALRELVRSAPALWLAVDGPGDQLIAAVATDEAEARIGRFTMTGFMPPRSHHEVRVIKASAVTVEQVRDLVPVPSLHTFTRVSQCVEALQARLGMSKIFLEPAGPGMPLTGRVHLAGPPETMDVAMEALQAMFQVPERFFGMNMDALPFNRSTDPFFSYIRSSTPAAQWSTA